MQEENTNQIQEEVVTAPEVTETVVEETPVQTAETVDHVVSEEDIALNPELAEAGVKVGETIGLAPETEVLEEGVATGEYPAETTEGVSGTDTESPEAQSPVTE